MSPAADHMDRMYRGQRHIYDASRKFYLLGRDGLVRELQPPDGGKVLEIGCGTARNLIVAAKAYPQAQFYGVDISSQMLETARKSIAGEKLEGRIQVAVADACDVRSSDLFNVEKFDRIFISYALSMIPSWEDVLDHAMDLLAPNGSLHIVDFGDFSGLPPWFGKAMKSWLAAFSVTPRENFEPAFATLASRRGTYARVMKPFRAYAFHAVAVLPGKDHSWLESSALNRVN